MYHNDNGQGYIRMAEGTKPPRSYRRPVYLVLDPSFIVDNQLYLTKNGVVLFHGDIPFQYLVILYLHQLQVVHGMPTQHGHML